MYTTVKKIIKGILPGDLYKRLLPFYHLTLVYVGIFIYRSPSRSLKVVGVTGTKGKSSVTEYINGILEEAGYKTAIISTIRFKVGDHNEPNMLKMTMPGRFFIQKYLAKARRAKCDWAIVEMTSEGTKQFRHKGIALDALVFTNISPEHIESHGSFENYVAAKKKIGSALAHSRKRPRTIVANADDEYGDYFLQLPVENQVPYTLENTTYTTDNTKGTTVSYNGQTLYSPFPGEFTAYNMLAAAQFAHTYGISDTDIKNGLEHTTQILGRVQKIDMGQPFAVYVDYAHTPDSLEKLYQAFPEKTKVCVLGNAGGGRDTWKRPLMGKIAEKYCSEVILTDEDPYDEDPRAIVDAMQEEMTTKPAIIMDRREAIKTAFTRAQKYANDAVVLITGKGTDPYIMRKNGTKEPWSDARVAKEELEHILK